jgi:hypothetical protein
MIGWQVLDDGCKARIFSTTCAESEKALETDDCRWAGILTFATATATAIGNRSFSSHLQVITCTHYLSINQSYLYYLTKRRRLFVDAECDGGVCGRAWVDWRDMGGWVRSAGTGGREGEEPPDEVHACMGFFGLFWTMFFVAW